MVKRQEELLRKRKANLLLERPLLFQGLLLIKKQKMQQPNQDH